MPPSTSNGSVTGRRMDLSSEVSVTIRDDGPGFSAEVMPRIGEPYVRGRRGQRTPVPDDEAGLGLGFFIAKTLLQRTGAHISVANNSPPDTGASIRISWQRKDFEVLAGSTGRTAPLSPDTDQHTYHPV